MHLQLAEIAATSSIRSVSRAAAHQQRAALQIIPVHACRSHEISQPKSPRMHEQVPLI